MKVYNRRANRPNKDSQGPFFESKNKTSDQPSPFFGPATVQRKEDPGKAGEEEKMKQTNPELEKDKVQAKEKEEDQKIQQLTPEAKEEDKVQKAPEPEKKDKETVQKKAIRMKTQHPAGPIRKSGSDTGQAASPDLETRLAASKGKGFALPNDLQQELGSKMNYDFSQVVIHTDSEAVAMAEELGALAFTHGNDIYFNAGQYAPQSTAGKQLLIHELTHVIQQM